MRIVTRLCDGWGDIHMNQITAAFLALNIMIVVDGLILEASERVVSKPALLSKPAFG
jgi:hypothetical protein